MKVTLQRRGTIRIVPSGATPYALLTDWLEIRKDGVTFRVDGEREIEAKAYMQLTGADWLTAMQAVRAAPKKFSLSARTKTESGIQAVSVESTTARINAGIRARLGYANMTEHGQREAEAIAATLSPMEWEAIRWGLDEAKHNGLKAE